MRLRVDRRPVPYPAAQEQHDGQDGAQDQPHGETSECISSIRLPPMWQHGILDGGHRRRPFPPLETESSRASALG
jgi:hypothetical protein